MELSDKQFVVQQLQEVCASVLMNKIWIYIYIYSRLQLQKNKQKYNMTENKILTLKPSVKTVCETSAVKSIC